MLSEEAVNGGLQVDDAVECAALETAVGRRRRSRQQPSPCEKDHGPKCNRSCQSNQNTLHGTILVGVAELRGTWEAILFYGGAELASQEQQLRTDMLGAADPTPIRMSGGANSYPTASFGLKGMHRAQLRHNRAVTQDVEIGQYPVPLPSRITYRHTIGIVAAP